MKPWSSRVISLAVLLSFAGAANADYIFRVSSKGVVASTPAPSNQRNLTLNSASPIIEYNIFTAAGSPSSPVDVTLIVEAGTLVTSTKPYNGGSGGVAGLSVGALPAGSTVTIINRGVITGAGGTGSSWTTDGTMSFAAGGSEAIRLTANVTTTIDNTSGYILGGGGGGQAGYDSNGNSNTAGGGGGGAGGGIAGRGRYGGGSGANGTNGSTGKGGAGGAGTYAGGAGGDYGQAGKIGYCNAPSYICVPGPAGKAIRVMGAPLTFTNGNNTSQVKGDVS